MNFLLLSGFDAGLMKRVIEFSANPLSKVGTLGVGLSWVGVVFDAKRNCLLGWSWKWRLSSRLLLAKMLPCGSWVGKLAPCGF